MSKALSELSGAELIATFGSTLHVSGKDEAKLAASLGTLGTRLVDASLRFKRIPPSLEDAFIYLMQGQEDAPLLPLPHRHH